MPNGQPVLPRSKENPVGQTRQIAIASKALTKALTQIEKWLVEQVEAIPAMTVNRYEYQIDPYELDRLVREIARELDQLPTQELVDQVMASYESGTGAAIVNLQGLTSEYTRTITSVIVSEPYRRRAALVQSRVFEEMAGFSGSTATDLGRVLRQGIEDGRNPRDLVDTISQRFDVSRSRAETIARTEITGAQRRARWDEDADANERLGIKTGLLWLSALSPTTRPTHSARHGEVYTQDNVREFYGRDGNAINCKCGQTSILLNDDGSVATPEVVRRVKAYKK